MKRLWCLLGILMLMTANPVLAQDPVERLEQWLQAKSLDDVALESLSGDELARVPLSQVQAELARELLWSARQSHLAQERRAELDARELIIGDLRMPFWFRVFGDAPKTGRSLFISMHGGGGAPAAVNDQQYENQKRLYQPKEGIYLVPRAPTNTWNLWHEGHIDGFFDRLISDLVVLENVDINRVYLMGYSAGGDGVYQLAPRMADRLAAAAMMAGHPNEARPDSLRNIGFALHMGANDGAYNRNTVAVDWGKRLDALQADDPDGYVHQVTIHEGKGHWMELQDAVAVPWMAEFTRNPWPARVVWVQDDVTHRRFYWLRNDAAEMRAGDRIVAECRDGKIVIRESSVQSVSLLLNDELISLDKPIVVVKPDGTETEVRVERTIQSLAQSLRERSDRSCMAYGTVSIRLSE